MMEYDYLLVMKCNSNNEPVDENGNVLEDPSLHHSDYKTYYTWIKIETSLGHPLVYNSRETTAHRKGRWMGGYTAAFRAVDHNDPFRSTIDWFTELVDPGVAESDIAGRLIITNNDVVGSPKPVTYFVNVPGSNRILDFSDYIANKPTYEQRTLTFDFAVELDPDICMKYYSEFLNLYHNRRIQVMLDYDNKDEFDVTEEVWPRDEAGGEPGSGTRRCHWVYEGRASVGQMKRNLSICTFTMTVECDPYKYALDVNNWWFNRSISSL